MKQERINHWENVYLNKSPNEVSWTQVKPEISLDFISQCQLPKTAKIIDVGGGDSKLVDNLLSLGYQDITVLDISAKAIARAKLRLGPLADKVTWIVSDIVDFVPKVSYDLWHDRATFHFLTQAEEIDTYAARVQEHVKQHLIIGSFSDQGPLKCSGLNITQYNEASLTEIFKASFKKINSIRQDHITPFDTKQNFVFCSFIKL